MRSRPLTVLLVAAALPLGTGAAGAVADPGAKKPKKGKEGFTYALPGERVFPEGIAVDRSNKRFYVSSTTDGTIFRGAAKGRAAEPFLAGGADGRTTAVGVKVDREGRLFVAGGATGSVFVYDTARRALIRRFDTGPGGFLNDVAIAPDGTAYVTDSQRPAIYRIPEAEVEAGRGDTVALAPFLTYPDFGPGFNANGIVAVDARTLVYVHSTLGRLYRVDVPSRTVQAIDLGGAAVTNGDGLVLKGHRLYVVRNAQELITEIKLAGDERSGRVVSETTSSLFAYPTTAALAKGRLLVVNSQFDRRRTGEAPEPFTVASVKKP